MVAAKILKIRNSTIGLSANSFERSLHHLRDLLSFADQAAAVDRVISIIIYTNIIIIITDPVAAVDRVIVIIVVIIMVIIVITIIYFIIVIIMIILYAIINA